MLKALTPGQNQKAQVRTYQKLKVKFENDFFKQADVIFVISDLFCLNTYYQKWLIPLTSLYCCNPGLDQPLPLHKPPARPTFQPLNGNEPETFQQDKLDPDKVTTQIIKTSSGLGLPFENLRKSDIHTYCRMYQNSCSIGLQSEIFKDLFSTDHKF